MLLRELINENQKLKKFTKEEAKELFGHLTYDFLNNKKIAGTTSKKLYAYLSDEHLVAKKSQQDKRGSVKAFGVDEDEFFSDYFSDMTDKEIQQWINERTE